MQAQSVSSSQYPAFVDPRQTASVRDDGGKPAETPARGAEEDQRGLSVEEERVPGLEDAVQESENRKAFKEAAEKIGEVVRAIQRDLKFEVHDETGMMYVRVTDVREGKVIRELPMKEILDTLARIENAVGLLVDGKA